MEYLTTDHSESGPRFNVPAGVRDIQRDVSAQRMVSLMTLADFYCGDMKSMPGDMVRFVSLLMLDGLFPW